MTVTMKKGLGKGIGALINQEAVPINTNSQSSSATATAQNVANSASHSTNSLDISLLKPGKYQPRTHFNETSLTELADSIRANGIMQPIVVRATEGSVKYEIIAGERRWRASKLAGLTQVPVIIRNDVNDKQALELALIENVQRQDLSALEEAEGYQKLIDNFNYTQDTLAQSVGKSRSHVSNLIRLLSLPTEVKQMMEDDFLSMGHARALISAENPIEIAKEIIRKGLNVRQTEKLVKYGMGGSNKDTGSRSQMIPARDEDIVALEETLTQNIGMKVRIKDRGNRGEITIIYEDLQQLDGVLQKLGGV